MRRLRWPIVAVLALSAGLGTGANGAKFYPDDPVSNIVDAEDASGVQEREIDLVYDTLENAFSWPGDLTPNVRAQSVNTIDEVPDSNWFVNRLGAVPVTVDEVVKGPGSGVGPAPGAWTVVAAKNDGVMPGFTVRDSTGQVWFIKFDPPGHPAMATGTEAVVARLFWALGYYVPETHVATLRPDELKISDEARITPPSGQRRRFKESDIRRLLRRAHRNTDGTYRVLASKALAGRPVGPFRFYGVRSDDPNDVTPHEHRRELRAYGTFAAWLNHVDSKSINTLDTVIDQGGRKVVRHHLLDSARPSAAPACILANLRGRRISRRGQEDAGGKTWLHIKDWRTARCTFAIGRRISDRQRAVGSRAVEAPVREFGVSSVTARRQVLGRTAAAGFHRRHAQCDHPSWPVQRSPIGGDALEVPDRASERHRPTLSAGGEPHRRPGAESFRDIDVRECRG